MRLTAILFASVTLFVTPARTTMAASCGIEQLRRSIQRETIAAVFSGTVVGVQFAAAGPILTFKVDTVWKGDVSPMMLVYHTDPQPPPPIPRRSRIPPPQSNAGSEPGRGVGPAISGVRPFDLARRYVVVAYRLTDDQRTLFHLDGGSERLGTDSCGGLLFDEAERIGHLDGVGPGRAPR